MNHDDHNIAALWSTKQSIGYLNIQVEWNKMCIQSARCISHSGFKFQRRLSKGYQFFFSTCQYVMYVESETWMEQSRHLTVEPSGKDVI